MSSLDVKKENQVVEVEQELIPVEDYLTIKINHGKEDRELFMAHGMLLMLVSYVETLDQFILSYSDPQTQRNLLQLVLAPRDEKGNIVEDDFNYDSLGINLEQANVILKWIEEHVLNFFIESAERTKSSVKSPRVQKLMRLLNGMSDSNTEMQSAGPLTNEEVTS